jgi:DNA mismatch repair protein MutS
MSQQPKDNPQASAPTPMMQQFIEIKSVNMDSLLFYRMGDFYELFFDDAEIASRALGITLTKRGKHQGQDIPMCGVPVHAAEDYLQKLIGLGHRVAVCEQTEDPAEAKKRGSKSVVRRDVVRLVTPGTVTEEKLLDPSASNFLATLSRVRKGEDDADMALAWIDISTGSFRVIKITPKELGAALARIEPRELVMPESIYSDPDLRPLILLDEKAITIESPTFFDSQMAVERLKENFNVGALEGFGDFTKAELSAAGAALAYIEKTQIDERPALMPPSREDADYAMFIDAATRANLELMRPLSGEKQGSLFHAINHTVSGSGGRMLAERMMSPLTDIVQITERQNSIAFLVENPEITQNLKAAIRQIPDMTRALSRLSLNRGGPRDLASLLEGFKGAGQIGKLLATQEHLPSEFAYASKVISELPDTLLQLLMQALADELPLLARDGGFIREGYHAELDELRKLRDESRRVIASMQLEYSQETSIKSLKIKHNNVLGYFIEVTANNADALMNEEGKARFIHRQTLANAMRFTTPELAEIETKIANAAGKAQQIELELFAKLVSSVLEQASEISRTADAIAILDVAQGLANLAETYEYCRPKVDESLAFEIIGGRHPVVEQVLKRDAQNPFVANDCNVGGDKAGKLWLLTGPNMGGKSTFLRQNALIIILAQMGSFVPARQAHIGIVDRLFSRVGAADDLARGRSTFMVEMVETAAILNQAEVKSFVILDEIGRGTATFDGLSIAWAAMEHLHEANLCRTLFATHYHELTSLAEPLDRLSNVTMKVKEWEGDVVFLHEVIPGTADRSYGIQVAKLAGLPPAVVSRARDVLDQLESSERSNNAHTLIDDLPLFSVTATEPVSKTHDNKLVEALEAISPDDLSPRQAQQALYDLRALLKSNS